TNHANSLSRGGAEVIQVTDADLRNIAASVRDAAEKLPVLTGTSALLADLPTKGELGQALTSTVALVNEHADENKDAIIAAIPSGSGGSASTYSLNLNIDQVPGTATGTATPA